MAWKILLLCVLTLLWITSAACVPEAPKIVSEEYVEAKVLGSSFAPFGGYYVLIAHNGVESYIDIAGNERKSLEAAGKVKACLVGLTTTFKDTLQYELRPKCSDSIKGGLMSPFLFG